MKRVLLYYSLVSVATILFMNSCTSGTDSYKETEVTSMFEAKIDSLMELMTLEEKTNLLHANSLFTSGGVERLDIPELVMSDGPHGVGKEHDHNKGLNNITTDSATYRNLEQRAGV